MAASQPGARAWQIWPGQWKWARARASRGVWFYWAQIKDTKVIPDFVQCLGFMHEKTIAHSHSVLMHVCMAEDFIQLSIKRPTDIGAGCALLAGTQQPVAWFETGFGFLARFWV